MIASVKPLLAFKRRKLSSLQLKLPNFSQGARGELAALTFLTSQGYIVVAQNLGWGVGQSSSRGELDLILKDPSTDEIVFVEVKTRRSQAFGHPSQAVSWHQQRAAHRVAQAFLEERGLENDYRFDIICVLPRQIEHFKNVTW